MEGELVQVIRCEGCGHEFARAERKEGKQQLVVHPPDLELRILSKQPDVFVAVCPECKYETVVDAELLKRF